MLNTVFDPQKFLNKNFLFAIVGASNDKHKPGFYVFENFLENGYKVVPVKTEESLVKEVQGEPCFPDISSVRPFPDAVLITDIEPWQTIEFLRQMRDKGIFRVWLEEGTYNKNTLDFCEQFKLEIYLPRNSRVVDYL